MIVLGRAHIFAMLARRALRQDQVHRALHFLVRRYVGGVDQLRFLKLSQSELQIAGFYRLLTLVDVELAGVVTSLLGAQFVFGVCGVGPESAFVVN